MFIQEKKKTIKLFLTVFFILIIYLVFSYLLLGNYFWLSITGSFLIIVISYLSWKKEFINILGLKIKFPAIIISLLFFIIVISASYFIIKYISAINNLPFDNKFNLKFFKYLIHGIGQTLNEEIILGGLLLLYLKKKIKFPFISSIVIALLFAVFHIIFYKIAKEYNRENLNMITILSLFLIGFIRNNLILSSGHIYYSWSLHLGWNAIFFGQTMTTNLNEPAKFNTFLGNTITLFFIIILLIFHVIILLIDKKTNNFITKNNKF